MNKLPIIYYISQGATPEAHLLNIEKVCLSGCKLVQLRLKGIDFETVLETAKSALSICQKYNAKLIINDYLKIAELLPPVGLHIGKQDPSIKTARQKLSNKLIGGTANTLEDCIRLANDGADYIGLGPYQFTSTKANLDPVLGLHGYREIKRKLETLHINTPIYAIGGIEEDDIIKLMNIGLNGIAVSGLLTKKNENSIKQIISHYE